MPFGLGTIAMIGGGALAAAGFIPIAIGFGTAGVVAGSVAAAAQSSIGAVAAGSTFATIAERSSIQPKKFNQSIKEKKDV